MKARLIVLGFGLPVLFGMVLPFFVLNLIHKTSPEKARQEFAVQYKEASDSDRLQLVIKAINGGLIHRGVLIDDIDALFGTNYKAETPTKGKPETRSVNFTPFIPSPREDMAGGFIGWRFIFTYNYSGRVEDYYLTNLHK